MGKTLSRILAPFIITGALASPIACMSREQKSYNELTKVYNSVNMNNLSNEEKEWLRGVKERGNIVEKIKEKEDLRELGKLYFDIDNPTDKDLIFLYRALQPLYDELEQIYWSLQPRH